MTTSPVVPNGGAALEWRQLGACVDMDPATFFPAGTRIQIGRQAKRAKQTCRTCAVTDACLQWAVTTQQSAGIWGGLNEVERTRVLPPDPRSGLHP